MTLVLFAVTTRPYEKQKVDYFADMGVLDACFTLLARAEETNAEYVQSYGNVNLHLCFDELVSIGETYEPHNFDDDSLDGISGSIIAKEKVQHSTIISFVLLSGSDEALFEQYGADLLGDDYEETINEDNWEDTADAEIGDSLDEYVDLYNVNVPMLFEEKKVVRKLLNISTNNMH